MQHSENCRWYKAPRGAKHHQLFAHVRDIESDQVHVREQNLAHAHLYSNRYEPGFDGGRGQVRSGYAALTENIIRSVIDTATSLIGKSRPKATIVTDGADWEVQNLARDLDQYLLSMFQVLRVHEKMGLLFRDACIFGTGCLQVYVHDDYEIRCERVLIDNIIVDESSVPEGGGLPRQIARVRYVPKEVLRAKYPQHGDAIDKATVSWRREYEYRNVDRELACVVESWHLPSGPDAGDGRYVCAIEGADLIDEPWEHEWFPFVFYRWSPPVTGFYGQGLAELLLDFQIRLNELNDFIRKAQDLIAVPRVAISHGSKVFKPQINNDIGAMIYYDGNPPQWFTAQAVGSEIYEYKEQLKAAAFEFAGISKMAAHATRPEGVEAAVAMRELSDNQSQRFSSQQQAFEDAYLDVAKLIAVFSAELYADGDRDREYHAPGTIDYRLIDNINWDLVDFGQYGLQMRVEASSILSESPAGRLQRVIELAQYGVITDQGELRRLLAHPDVPGDDARKTSAIEHSEWTISRLLRGEILFPEPFMDLVGLLERVTAAYLDAERRGAPEEILENLRAYIEQTQGLMETAQAAEQAPQGPAEPGAEAPPPEAGLDPSMELPPEAMGDLAGELGAPVPGM